LTVNSFKYTQFGRSVRLQRQLQLNSRPTVHEVFPGNVLYGKMTIRETSFRESNHPGKRPYTWMNNQTWTVALFLSTYPAVLWCLQLKTF